MEKSKIQQLDMPNKTLDFLYEALLLTWQHFKRQ
jgi:hypothetical protein